MEAQVCLHQQYHRHGSDVLCYDVVTTAMSIDDRNFVAHNNFVGLPSHVCPVINQIIAMNLILSKYILCFQLLFCMPCYLIRGVLGCFHTTLTQFKPCSPDKLTLRFCDFFPRHLTLSVSSAAWFCIAQGCPLSRCHLPRSPSFQTVPLPLHSDFFKFSCPPEMWVRQTLEPQSKQSIVVLVLVSDFYFFNDRY